MKRTLSIVTRNILVLSAQSTLTKEESWLREGYENIVAKLVKLSISTDERFDPIASRYYGIHSIKADSAQYKALLELTSYFWASKGGRGALLEKVIADTAGRYAANNVPLKSLPAMISARNTSSNSVEFGGWSLSKHKTLRFDLVNVVNDELIILEIKNRVDSGGVGAREEAFIKKFFTICDLALKGSTLFKHNEKEYTLTDMLSSLKIKSLSMHIGLLYGIDGREASRDSDRKGFGSRSKNVLLAYCEGIGIDRINLDRENLGLSFQADGIQFAIESTYGNDVLTKFMRCDNVSTNLVMNKIFTNIWDDIWLALSTTIYELTLLRKNGTSNLLSIDSLYQSDNEFKVAVLKIAEEPMNITVLNSALVQTKMKLQTKEVSDQHILDCLYCYAAYNKNKKTKKKKKIKESIIRAEEEDSL